MVYDGVIKGHYVSLTAVTEADASFTLMVRQDPRLTKYLPRINNTLEQQAAWIRRQRQKDGDYFFVARDLGGDPVGTIAIYDIHGDTGEGGRLTSIGNALQSLEIQYLILKFDFEILKLEKVTAYVFANNRSAYKLSEKFGIRFEAPTLNADGHSICYGSVTREQFDEAVPRIEKMLYRNESQG